MITAPVSVKLFTQRAFYVAGSLLAIQFLHVSVIADAPSGALLTWLIVAMSSIGLMYLIVRKIDENTVWPNWNHRLFAIFFLISYSAVMLFSRVPYIQSYLEYGLYATRINEEVGGGGIYSIFTVLFYPLCIILAFIDLPRRQYYVYALLMLTVIAVDFIVIGTRNAPIFVLVFHFLMYRGRFTSFRNIILFCSCLIIFVILFDYQSRNRSLDPGTVGWNWAENLRYTWLMEHLPISENVIRTLELHLPYLLPVVFIMHYISHSIAAFTLLVSNGIFGFIGSPAYFYDQMCIAFKCNREYTAAWIHELNPDAGMYQTLYSSLLFDLGWIGLAMVMMILIYYYLSRFNKVRTFPALSIYLLIIFATSSVENYIYNGLGIWRFLTFIALSWVLSCFSKAQPIFKCK
jgi:hypothetical protein